MKKRYILLFITIGFVLTFSTLFWTPNPTVSQSKGILDRSLKAIGEKPQEGVYYTLNHKTGKILKWNKIVGDP